MQQTVAVFRKTPHMRIIGRPGVTGAVNTDEEDCPLLKTQIKHCSVLFEFLIKGNLPHPCLRRQQAQTVRDNAKSLNIQNVARMFRTF